MSITSAPSGIDRIGPFRLGGRRAGEAPAYDAVDERDGTAAVVVMDDARWLGARVEAARRAWATEVHPAFARLLAAGVDADSRRAYFGTERLGGRSVRELAQAGPAGVREAVEVARQALAAASALHARGGLLWHGADDVRVELHDGRPRARLELTLHPRRREEPPAVAGSPAFEAPEVSRRPDERADVWRAGVLLHLMLAGESPFAGATPTEVTDAVARRQPAPLRVDLGVPRALQQVLWRALEKNPDDRFRDAKDFAAALAAF